MVLFRGDNASSRALIPFYIKVFLQVEVLLSDLGEVGMGDFEELQWFEGHGGLINCSLFPDNKPIFLTTNEVFQVIKAVWGASAPDRSLPRIELRDRNLRRWVSTPTTAPHGLLPRRYLTLFASTTRLRILSYILQVFSKLLVYFCSGESEKFREYGDEKP